MKKYHSPRSLNLTLGKESLYKDNHIHIGTVSLACCKCQDDNAVTPAPVTPVESLKDLIGMPQPWPLADAPEGWLKCNGQAFDTAKYPQLAKLYPTGKLPDLRGEFIRGWDDARSIDADRQLLSEQTDAIRNITGNLYYGVDADGPLNESYFSGALYYDLKAIVKDTKNNGSWTNSNVANAWAPAIFDASRVVPTAAENRPRNVAFSYIVKAG
ncbi:MULTISPECIES: phage tail protein [Dickeya]|uniref:Alternative bacteriophage tail fiber C-terminus n=1 Tax=Dickeya aquatica TaxID=1401087 RepID=A0A375ABZ8_9GAMM|nr:MULTISPECIES: phage tail protein [Dickeya]SLM63446.1 alternative bacteriophage tail fiber C-terminus [Dickeya aquatica]